MARSTTGWSLHVGLRQLPLISTCSESSAITSASSASFSLRLCFTTLLPASFLRGCGRPSVKSTTTKCWLLKHDVEIPLSVLDAQF